jgi:hypothetical protein
LTPGRRALTFASRDELMPDVERLLQGHTTVGKWLLGQICGHLAQSLHDTIGFPVRAPWLVRKTVGPLLLRWVLRRGRFIEGMKAPPQNQPAPGVDARAAAEALRAALTRLAAHTGPLVEHPFGGCVTREVWERFHCVHCAHHLSFAVPADGGRSGREQPGRERTGA